MVQGRLKWIAVLAAVFTLQGVSASELPEAVPGEYVVKLKSSVGLLSLDMVANILNADVIRPLSKESNSVLVRKSVAEKREFVVQSLSQNPWVEYAEPNYIYRLVGGASELPNDPELPQLWGLINNGQDIAGQAGRAGMDVGAERAWQIETGSQEVLVSVIDTGVNYDLPDLAPNMWKNEAELNGEPGVDDDGNGYVDDIHGYDFANKDADPMDDHGHGSHVSGTIGANGNDGVGIVGVAWKVKIIPIKFLSRSGGGSLADAVSAIDYSTAMGAVLSNNSWGGGGFSQALYDSIQRAQEAGTLFLAAAGNSRNDNDSRPSYPATYDLDNIVSVAAIDNAGNLASFSSYGRTTVDVAAPGVDILSWTTRGLQAWSGTSMATPHVTGVAALLRSANPDMSIAEIKDRLIRTSKPVSSVRNKVVARGIVDAYYALTDQLAPADPNDPFNWDKSSYEISSPHPYTDNFAESWTVEVPGAERVAIYFGRFETESGYDKVTFKNAAGEIVGTLSGNHTGAFSPVVEGNTIIMEFSSDGSVNGYGFDVEAVAYQ